MDQLSLEIRDGIAVITFSNPPLQVMTPATLNELNRMLPDLRSDDIRAIVFTGSDSTFFIRHFSVEELDENARGGGGGWWPATPGGSWFARSSPQSRQPAGTAAFRQRWMGWWSAA